MTFFSSQSYLSEGDDRAGGTKINLEKEKIKIQVLSSQSYVSEGDDRAGGTWEHTLGKEVGNVDGKAVGVSTASKVV